jgi:hypothetical protein
MRFVLAQIDEPQSAIWLQIALNTAATGASECLLAGPQRTSQVVQVKRTFNPEMT